MHGILLFNFLFSQIIAKSVRDLLNLEEPNWNKSISLPPRSDLGKSVSLCYCQLTLCMLGNFATFFLSADLNILKNFQEYHPCRSVWIQIRPDILFALGPNCLQGLSVVMGIGWISIIDHRFKVNERLSIIIG